MKLTIIGSGNMGGAIARGLARGTMFKASDITCTALTDETLERMRAFDPAFRLTHDNAKAACDADIVLIAVKPWYVEKVINEIKRSLDFDRQIIVSVAAGVSFDQLTEYLTSERDMDSMSTPTLFQVIPNTAIEVRSSMTFVAARNASREQTDLILRIFNELGKAALIDESLMASGTALASCGIAFALRYIRAAIEGGVELGIPAKQAQEIVAYTVRGAADLLIAHQSHPEAEIDKVTTPGGITIKGLNEMERAGFTPAVIQGLRACR